MDESKKGGKGGDYTVGYGKPPLHTRFKPGENRNPGKRRKRHLTFAEMLAEEMTRLIPVTENGVTKKMSKEQVVIKTLAALAMKGNAKAVQFIINMTDTTHRRADGRQGPTARQMVHVKRSYPQFQELLRDIVRKAIANDRIRTGRSPTDPEY